MWNIVDKYEVNKLYTSPTAVRALSALGDKWVKECVLFELFSRFFYHDAKDGYCIGQTK